MEMGERLNFWILGGDPRQQALAEALAGDGHEVHTYALEETPGESLEGIWEAHCVVLPLPAAQGENLNAPLCAREVPLAEVLDPLLPGQLVCAGMVSPFLREQAESRGLHLEDYFAREELAVANAVPSSEGAIQIAMEELPITLHGARVLVIGAGRLGKVLCQQLMGLGAQVAVAARKYADLAWIQVRGGRAVRSDRLAGALEDYDLILNTVPAPLLDRAALETLRPGGLVIDLASKPGGVDFDAARELGVKVIWALSLPGKVAPVTAGRAIQTAIYNLLTELGV